ncbi:hypothetical protein GW17_00030643 [Ensete ventricosum]|nr:hypothetical protein GW17_00030643 [Ensete ventricosum]
MVKISTLQNSYNTERKLCYEKNLARHARVPRSIIRRHTSKKRRLGARSSSDVERFRRAATLSQAPVRSFALVGSIEPTKAAIYPKVNPNLLTHESRLHCCHLTAAAAAVFAAVAGVRVRASLNHQAAHFKEAPPGCSLELRCRALRASGCAKPGSVRSFALVGSIEPTKAALDPEVNPNLLTHESRLHCRHLTAAVVFAAVASVRRRHCCLFSSLSSPLSLLSL